MFEFQKLKHLIVFQIKVNSRYLKKFNTDINIKMNKKGKGKLVIYFENEEDLC